MLANLDRVSLLVSVLLVASVTRSRRKAMHRKLVSFLVGGRTSIVTMGSVVVFGVHSILPKSFN